MNVLSLFDGISCGRIALERAGININNYFASEIDENAIKVSKKNYCDIIHIGDVKFVRRDMFPKIDLLIGGSPCQDLSIVKKERKGLNGEKSGLFYEYLRMLKNLSPKYFLLENVASMSNFDKNEISKLLEVEPILINSALVSAQNRKRYYWTNIPNISQPCDKNIFLKDILEDLPFRELRPFAFNKNAFGMKGMKKVNDLKSNTLTTSKTHSKMYLLNEDKTMFRNKTVLEYERLQTLPEGYVDNCDIKETAKYRAIGNGWTVDVITHILRGIK